MRSPQYSTAGFSALQRAEIAEIPVVGGSREVLQCFSALQRAEIAEIAPVRGLRALGRRFSALQRAEIAEIGGPPRKNV